MPQNPYEILAGTRLRRVPAFSLAFIPKGVHTFIKSLDARLVGRYNRITWNLCFGRHTTKLFEGIAVYFSQTSAFTEERLKNSDAYLLDIRKMNGADSHTFSLLKNGIFLMSEDLCTWKAGRQTARRFTAETAKPPRIFP